MDSKRNSQDVKKLYEELNKLTGILSAVKRSTNPQSSTKIVNAPKKNVFEHPPESHNCRLKPSVPVQKKVPFNNVYPHYNGSSHSQSSHRYTNPSLYTNYGSKNYYKPNESFNVRNLPQNSRYSKTNSAPSQSLSAASQSKYSISRVTVNTTRTISASNNRTKSNVSLPTYLSEEKVCVVNKCVAKSLDSKRTTKDESVACEKLSSSVADLSTVKLCTDLLEEISFCVYKYEIKEVVQSVMDEMLSTVEDIVLRQDVKVPKACNDSSVNCYQKLASNVVLNKEGSIKNISESYPPSHSSDSTKICAKVLVSETSLKAEIPSVISTSIKQSAKVTSRSDQCMPSQSSEQIWKSKYKVVNKHANPCKGNGKAVPETVAKRNPLKNITSDLSLSKNLKKNVDKVTSSRNKYKYVKNDENKQTGTIKKDAIVNRTSKIRQNSKTLSRSPYLHKTSAWKSNGNQLQKSKAFGAKPGNSSKMQNILSESLTEQLNQLEFKTRSLYKGYDLSLISPMELVALDHKSLLKIAAAQTNKPELFTKKSKYKIVSGNKSAANQKKRNLHKRVMSIKQKVKLLPTKVPQNVFAMNSKTRLSRKNHFRTNSVSGLNNSISKMPPQQTRSFANRALYRSIKRVTAASSKKMAPNTSSYCIFFNRFGKCNRAEDCPYIHDPSKIAVCTRFLRGSCKIKGCPFSHEVNPGKMAICSFFLQGACKKNEACPYRHETLKPGTELCKSFVKGYCPLGSECKKAHILICPDYAKGECRKGDNCLYPHPLKKIKRKIEEDFAVTNIKKTKEEKPSGNEENEEFRYFSHDPSTGEIKYFDVGDATSFPPSSTQVKSLPQYIPLHFKTQYVPEKFSDAECLE